MGSTNRGRARRHELREQALERAEQRAKRAEQGVVIGQAEAGNCADIPLPACAVASLLRRETPRRLTIDGGRIMRQNFCELIVVFGHDDFRRRESIEFIQDGCA